MRVRSLAPMRCNAHKIERRVEARYDAVEAITFVLNCNRHRHVHAMLAVGRTFIDVHNIRTNVSRTSNGNDTVGSIPCVLAAIAMKDSIWFGGTLD